MRTWVCTVMLGVLWARCLSAAAATADVPLTFDADVKPLIADHCSSCHGAGHRAGGLVLDDKAGFLKGGDSGKPAIVPGSSAGSHLIVRIAGGHPSGLARGGEVPLRPDELLLLKRWIDGGAHWEPTAPAAAPEAVTPARPLTDQDRAFWSFVPPKPVEPPNVKQAGWAQNRIDSFIAARLEAKGMTPSGEAAPSALLRRVTYDLIGLPPTPEELDAYLRDTGDSRRYERLVDRLLASPRFGERMASMWLPLARYAEDQAHQVGTDTKYFYPHAWKYRQWVIDAFNRDLPYDRFVLFQVAADKADNAAPTDLAALGFLGLGPKYYDRERPAVLADEWEDRVDTVTRTMLGLTVACARCHDHKSDPVSQEDYYALAGVFASTRMVNKTPAGVVQEGELEAEKVDPAALHVVMDGEPQDLNVFVRGDVERKGPLAPRRFLRVLSPDDPAPFKDGSGRLELARAIADPANPLTARVMVNRVWGLMFGAPLVATPSNFGRSGQPPTHPELLDDLAVRFVQAGWSVKWLAREIATSATYRQSTARGNPDYDASDPSNALLWRMNRRRLTVEQWRDGVLAVAGRLETSAEATSTELDNPTNCRRTVYARISRLKLDDLLMQFDYPDANVHAESRSVTNTPVQKLFMLNGPFVLEQAQALAARVRAEAPESEPARVRHVYRLLFSRQPNPEELSLGVAFVGGGSEPGGARRWEQYAHLLLASNEALYVD